MSELQIALLVIGCSVIVAVYVWGWWQQKHYRRKFGAAFKTHHADALYRSEAPQSDGRMHSPDSDALFEHAAVDGVTLDEADVPNAGLSAATPPDDACSLLDARIDYIIELLLAEAGSSAVLDGLWQRKFDFGKPVQVCGLKLATQQWERAIAESQTLYARFRIALQLADRGGAISAVKLAEFRDLALGIAKHIKADATVPDINQTLHRAVELDAFCSEVDQMVGVNLVAPGKRSLTGAMIAQAADAQGMSLESDGAFHLLDARGHSLLRLINRDARTFQHHTLESFSTPGITLLLDVPRAENPVAHFDRMMRVAHQMAEELSADVVDDHGMALVEGSLALIRAQLADVSAQMRDRGIAPGSAQARRLFS